MTKSSLEMGEKVSQHFAKTVQETLKNKKICSVVLSGGNTPKLFLSRLAQEPYRSSIPWEQIHFFWGDERCVPPDHADSNFRMVQEALLSHVSVPVKNIYRIPAEQKDPLKAAALYESTLRKFFNISGPGFPHFDIIFLGLGADGHTASLFPGSDALDEKDAWVVATSNSPQGLKRITLTLPVLNNAEQVVFVVQGSDKSEILKKILDRVPTSESLPAQRICLKQGILTWFITK